MTAATVPHGGTMDRKIYGLAFLLFLACWATLGGGGGACGCGGCPPEEDLCPGPNPVYPIASDPTWTVNDGEGLAAASIVWTPSYAVGGSGLALSGNGEACMDRGGVYGPIPPNAVYECFDEDDQNPYIHCQGGTQAGCPSPCFEYHTAEGIAHNRSGPTSYENVCIRREGDGISAEIGSGGFMVDRAYMAGIHDDAIEHDECPDLLVRDTLIESTFQGFAVKPRSSVPTDCTGSTLSILGNLVKLQEFDNTYKQRPGHGGLFKTEAGNQPKLVMRANHVLFGPVVGNGQEVIPTPGSFVNTTDCANNVYYFRGDDQQWASFLADEDGTDSYSNGERLQQLAYCITVIRRDAAAQSDVDFMLEYWSPLVWSWKDNVNHTADDEC